MLDKIRSIYIVNRIFDFIKNKRKLKIIRYTKKFQKSLGITKKDFKVYELLQEFNQKYKTDIDDIDIFELDLTDKKLGNEGLNSLFKIEFKNLSSLTLCDNEITNINIFAKEKFKNLKDLDLGDNRITDIKVLEKAKFEDLEELYFDNNQISNIDILAKVNLKKLKILNFRENQISNINVLE